MRKLFFFLLYVLSFFSLYGLEEYTEPQEVAATEGLPSSLINQAVCAISGEYTDSIVDLVLPGPEPLTISRVYTSFRIQKPWSFNHCDKLILGDVLYDHEPSYIVAFRQPSNAQLDYIFQKTDNYKKLKKIPFKLVVPKGLTNGASALSGKTNIKNQTLHFYPDDYIIIAQSGAGNRKTFEKVGNTKDGWPICSQISEEKVNGSCIRYEGKPSGMSGTEKVICENKENKKLYSFVKFSNKHLGDDIYLETLTASDGRELSYFIKHDCYKVKEKIKNAENNYHVDRFYLTKVMHPYAPHEKYSYREKALSKDMHISSKSRDEGNRFLNIEYYQKGVNHVGGVIGYIDIKEKDDFRLDRVKKLQAPVGYDKTAITTHRFDYHATIKKHKKDGHKKVADGYTDVYDAKNHKTRYVYDKEYRLTSIIRYCGTDDSTYAPYTKESFVWNDEGSLIAKIFKDGNGNVHHAKTFSYDSHGNVLTSTLCGKLTGNPTPPLILDDNGLLVENGYERATKVYTYSDNGLNLLLSETDSAGKTIRYKYKSKSDLIKGKYLSYNGQIRLREFYFYDSNNTLEKKILDDGCQESHEDLCYVNERHYTFVVPRTEAPVGLPERIEEWAHDFFNPNQDRILLKRSLYDYSKEGRLIEQQVFDANAQPAYKLHWDYDLHGNQISETNAMGVTIERKYDQATDNLIEESSPDVTILNTYDFANRLIEKREIHPDQTFETLNNFDYLGNCKTLTNAYGHTTHQYFDDFNRVIEIHYPKVPKDGILRKLVKKISYDIAGFPVSLTDANGGITQIEVNIRGQPTKVIYPDGTKEEMIYSLEGWLMQKTAKNGTPTEFVRDPLGRIIQETIYGTEGVKKTFNRHNAFHLIESTDPEGNQTTYSYDPAGRLKEIVQNHHRTEQLYDSLGRLSEIREYYGNEPHEYRSTIRKYDMLHRLKEEHLQNAEGQILHFSCYAYDIRGNRTLVQTGDQKTITEYNSWNKPIKIIDGLRHTTHIDYNTQFISTLGQKVLQTTTTDPLGYRTVETYDAANRLSENIRFNPFGIKIARQAYSYDLAGNQTEVEEEVIEDGKTVRSILTLIAYNSANQITQIKEAAGTREEKISSIRYNAFGQKEAFIKPDGKEINYTYDAFERLRTQTSSDHTISYHYEYNLLDQATRVIDLNSGKATIREYFQGDLIQETLANGLGLHYNYDRTGRARTVTFPDQTGIDYLYNAVDLKDIYRLNHKHRTYAHLDLEHSLSGQITKAQPPGNNGTISTQFDLLDRCVSIESTPFRQHIPENGFDPAGNLTTYSIQNNLYLFAYDENYQLKSESGHCNHTYAFDSLSNRISKDGQQHHYNALNQLVRKGDQELVYDLNGNLTRHGACEYTYDALDRLLTISCNNNHAKYSYDPFNRRVAKTINGEEELFLYQGQDEIGRWKNGLCQEIRLIGKNRQSRTAAIEINGVPYVPFHDIRGNITTLATLQGEVVEEYRYTAYGETEIFGPSGEKRVKSAVGNPWQYAGKRIDEETGLIAFGMRYYDPSLGRWTTPDPAGFIDGPNLYAYVHNNPLQYLDQFGLFAGALSFIGKNWFPFLEDNYQHFTSFLSSGTINDSQFGSVNHFSIEDQLEAEHQISKGPFHRTQHYHINDLKDGKDNYYQYKEMPAGKRVLFMCGIGNTFKDFKESLDHLAQAAGGYNVEGIFCPTFGWVLDYKTYDYALREKACLKGQDYFKRFCGNSMPINRREKECW